MAFEHWYCEACGKEGNVRYPADSGDVYSVRNRIAAAHSKRATACHSERGLTVVRVGFPPKRRALNP